MAEKKSRKVDLETSRTLTDEQIVTEKKLPRRSFLTTTGALLVAGAAALVSGVGATAQDAKPAEAPKKESDPDAKKKEGTKSGKKDKKAKAKTAGKEKEADPDKPKEKPPQR